MLLDIADIDEYVKANDLKEITSNKIFTSSSSIPDPEGIVSYEIFGNPGTRERKMTFAYISLGDYFLHPMCYDTLCFLKPKIIKDLVNGVGDYFIRNGNIVKVTDSNPAPSQADVGNGVNWLRRNLSNIVFNNSSNSNVVKDRINFITGLKPTEIFCNKWLVLPPYYRDVDITKSNRKNDINILYLGLLSQAAMVKSTMNLFGGYIVTDAHKRVQEKINGLYRYFFDFQAGTKKFIQQHVIGKAIDYSARMVISTPKLVAPNPRDMEVDFSHSAVPLAMVIKCFTPFIVYGLKKFVNDKLGGSNYIYKLTDKGIFEKKELASYWTEVLLSENIRKSIELYNDSKERRTDPFVLETVDEDKVPLVYITPDKKLIYGEIKGIKNIEELRPLTMCELFYIVAMNTVRNKSIFTTRYPVEDYHNIYPSLMNIIPYYKTEKVIIDNIEYPRYPMIDIKDIKSGEIGSKFVDTVRLFPTYLSALNADFDGDTISIQGIWTRNSGSEEYIYSKTNFINIGGGTMRTTGHISAHTIYALTQDKMTA
jgi:hypothetical protein